MDKKLSKLKKSQNMNQFSIAKKLFIDQNFIKMDFILRLNLKIFKKIQFKNFFIKNS